MSLNPFSNPFTPMSLAAWAIAAGAAYILFRPKPAVRHEVARPFTDAQRDAWNKAPKQ